MTEPNDPTPAPEETPTNWIAVVSSYKPTIDRFLLVMTSLIALAGAVYNGCQASKHGEQLDQVQQKQDVTAEKVQAVDEKATVAAKTGAANAQAIANQTGDPVAQKAATDAKAELRATTQGEK